MGGARVAAEPIMKAHKPKKKSNKIFLICGDTKLRIFLIEAYRLFCQARRQIYEQWKKGNFAISGTKCIRRKLH